MLNELSTEDRLLVAIELAKAATLTQEDYVERFAPYYDQVETRANLLAQQLGAGEIGVLQFRDRLTRLLRRAYVDAFRYGVGAAGDVPILSDVDLARIRRLLVEDLDYLDNFIRQFKSGYVPINPEDRQPGMGRFALEERTRLYANALREVFYFGFTSRASALQEFNWRLGVAEHCDPCVAMADGSPWTLEALGDRRPGASVCDGLTRCQCSLTKA